MAAHPVRALAAALAVWLPGHSPASADPEAAGPWADISIELENEYVFESDDPELELNDMFATIEADLGFAFDAASGLRATVNFEPVTDPTGDRYFEDMGLYLEELYLYGTIAGIGLAAGKFDPWFDLATDYAPGLYGDDIAGEYELTERIGGAVSVPFQALDIDHRVPVSAFMADRTILAESLFTNRGRLRQSDGGSSNTDWPQSVAAALTGETDSTIYNLAVRYQATTLADEKDETGIVAGFVHETELAGTDVLLFAEGGHFENFDGEPDPLSLVTLAAEIAFGDFAFVAAVGASDAPHAPASHLATVSLEYEVVDGLTAEAGYLFLDDEGVNSHVFGVLLTYDLSLR